MPDFRGQGWCNGESTCLPPMWAGFNSQCWLHMWFEFVVGSLPCSKRFFSGYFGFPPSQKPTFPNSNFDLKDLRISFFHEQKRLAYWQACVYKNAQPWLRACLTIDLQSHMNVSESSLESSLVFSNWSNHDEVSICPRFRFFSRCSGAFGWRNSRI